MWSNCVRDELVAKIQAENIAACRIFGHFQRELTGKIEGRLIGLGDTKSWKNSRSSPQLLSQKNESIAESEKVNLRSGKKRSDAL